MTRPATVNRRISILLTMALAAGPTFSQAPITERLPEIGDISGNIMTPAEEQRLGKAFMRSIMASEKVLEDPLLVDYLQDLGRSLANNSDDASGNYTFFLIDNPQINAFAGPAGYIGVFTGLILTSQTESELAAVMAHEIAHVTQAHLRRAWQMASSMSVPQAAVLLAAVVLGATVGGDAGLAAAAAGQAGLIQQQINFTRSNEREADRVGIGVLAKSDFEPRAMASFFQRLGRASRGEGSEIPEYLRTHPVTSDRIADSQGRAAGYPFRQRVENVRFHMLRAALRERQITNAREALLQFEQSLKEGRYRHEDAERFGYVLALMRNERLGQARLEIDKLLRKRPTLSELIIVSARLHHQSGNTGKGLQELRNALKLFPTNYSLTMTLAELLLAEKKASEAYGLLRDQAKIRPTDARIYELLARAATAIGQKTEGHEYLAEHYYLLGNLKGALLQLEIALRDKQLDFYKSSRLESRRNIVKNEFEELEKRAKKK